MCLPVVNEDNDPSGLDTVLWAMSSRCDPAQDTQIVRYREPGHGPRSEFTAAFDSAMLIDAAMKYPMPSLALPKREHMEEAKVLWEKLGLPTLQPESPWYGYSLGDWSDEWDRNAAQATRGEYMQRDAGYQARRAEDQEPNSPVPVARRYRCSGINDQ